jgi:hypothetical protein
VFGARSAARASASARRYASEVESFNTLAQRIPASQCDIIPRGGKIDLIYNPTAGNDLLPDGNYVVLTSAGKATDVAGNTNALSHLSTTFFPKRRRQPRSQGRRGRLQPAGDQFR